MSLKYSVFLTVDNVYWLISHFFTNGAYEFLGLSFFGLAAFLTAYESAGLSQRGFCVVCREAFSEENVNVICLLL